MKNRLRSLDSKISFFAFADIITAVSGLLIFIALLLATDLGKPTDQHSSENSEFEQQLQETLARLAEVDAQNQRQQELLAAADTAPNLEKLQADITRLRSQLSEERQKQSSLAKQMAGSQAATAARDQTLGLTDLKASIQRMEQEVESIISLDAKARSEMAALEQQVAHEQSQLLKLRQRDGQLWLIPDRSATTKEPILVTIGGTGVTMERFDHPDQRRQLGKSGADSAFRSYLGESKAINQYVVFLVRPSGIELFHELEKTARGLGFEIGFDALEENREIHFTTPPPVDDAVPSTDTPQTTPAQKPSATNDNSAPPGKNSPVAAPPKTNTPPTVPPSAASTPKSKSWWQRFLAWIGIS